MEAPGIEPGSERLWAKGTTCVSRRRYESAYLRACERSRPRPLISTLARRFASRQGPAGADVHTRYPALAGERAAYSYAARAMGSFAFLLGRLFTWPADQPRHAPCVVHPPSKPVRPRD